MEQRSQNTVVYIRSILGYNFISLSHNSADAGGTSLVGQLSSAGSFRDTVLLCAVALLHCPVGYYLHL